MNRLSGQKRIPTVLGIILLVATLSVTSLLVRKNPNFLSNASPDSVPMNVQITNITDSSFEVSYVTSAPSLGSVRYGIGDTLDQVGTDIQDQTTGPTEHTAHILRVKGLQSHTTYHFTILSGDKTYQDNTMPYTVLTFSTLAAPAGEMHDINGKVISPDENPLGETLIRISGEALQPVSVVTKADGSFSLPLTAIRTPDGKGYATLSDTAKLTFLFQNNLYTSSAVAFFSQTNPLPLITLSQRYDFTQNVGVGVEIASSSGDLSAIPTVAPQKQTPQPQITTPYKDQGFTDQQPYFKGNALPYARVTIQIQSTSEVTATITADGSGAWTYRPSQPLSPGKHLITISTKDAFGIVKTLQQSFTVYAAGSQIDGAPSVAPVQPTATPTPKPTNSPIPTATTTPTPGIGGTSATGTPVPSPTITLAPTAIPTPTTVPTIAPTAVQLLLTATPVPTKTPLAKLQTGSNVTIFAIIFGMTTTGIGLLMFFLSRNSKFV